MKLSKCASSSLFSLRSTNILLTSLELILFPFSLLGCRFHKLVTFCIFRLFDFCLHCISNFFHHLFSKFLFHYFKLLCFCFILFCFLCFLYCLFLCYLCFRYCSSAYLTPVSFYRVNTVTPRAFFSFNACFNRFY